MEDTGQKPRYHHGALREALIAAAEAELSEAGIEAFSLRRVAKRAGVSHAAPAHHFGDACGLLTALAAKGYERFVEAQRRREAVAPDSPAERLLASGLGLIEFAQANPALFRLIFTSQRLDFADVEFCRVAKAAFDHLCAKIEALRGVSPHDDPSAMLDALAAWSTAHGIADLLISGQLRSLAEMPEAAREAALSNLIRRALPPG